MGKSRTELTRLSLLPLYDIETALFVPVTESELAEFVVTSTGESVEQPVEVDA